MQDLGVSVSDLDSLDRTGTYTLVTVAAVIDLGINRVFLHKPPLTLYG